MFPSVGWYILNFFPFKKFVLTLFFKHSYLVFTILGCPSFSVITLALLHCSGFYYCCGVGKSVSVSCGFFVGNLSLCLPLRLFVFDILQFHYEISRCWFFFFLHPTWDSLTLSFIGLLCNFWKFSAILFSSMFSPPFFLLSSPRCVDVWQHSEFFFYFSHLCFCCAAF